MPPISILNVDSAFSAAFGATPVAVAKAPGRVNLIGEHTDYNNGFVLPFAIDRYTWAAARTRADDLIRVRSHATGDEQSWPHGAWDADRLPHWTSYIAGVAELLRRRGARLGGFDLLITGDVPLGAGLASSASLEIAVAKALIALSGEPIDAAELAALCRLAEHDFARVPCGIMDQYASIHGCAGHALLLDCRTHQHQPVPLHFDGLTLLVIHSGVRHELAAGHFALRRRECRDAVAYFRDRDSRVRSLRDLTSAVVRAHASQMPPLAAARALHVTSENERVLDFARALRDGDQGALGPLMAASHRSLRDDYEVSCPQLDQLVELASVVPGVIGARMTGGGFGGAIIAIVRDVADPRLREAIERGYSPPENTASHERFFTVRPSDGASIERG